MTTNLQHGLFIAPYHDVTESPTIGLRRDLELVEHVEKLGFAEAWFGEHHSTGWETICSPELMIAAAFAAFWLFTSTAVNPLLGLFLIVPAAYAVSWAIYRLLLTPLVRRAPNRDALEVDSILATFGMLFVIQGVMLVMLSMNRCVATSVSFIVMSRPTETM